MMQEALEQLQAIERAAMAAHEWLSNTELPRCARPSTRTHFNMPTVHIVIVDSGLGGQQREVEAWNQLLLDLIDASATVRVIPEQDGWESIEATTTTGAHLYVTRMIVAEVPS